MLSDPLRFARLAVRAGHFRDAASALTELPPTVRGAPEWHLLSAMTAWRLGNFEESRRHALEARARFRAVGDADGEMRAENVAAAGGFGLGQLHEAEEGFTRARQLARQLGDDLLMARCSNNLGNIALYLARHEQAHGFYRLARAGFERLGFDYGVAETWINTSIAWRDVGQFEEAAAASDQALDAAERAEAPRLIAEALSTRGEAMAAKGDHALGRLQVERALMLARQEGDRLAEADALRILATIARATGAHEEAEGLAHRALEVATAVRHPWGIAEIQREIGEMFRALGRHAEAVERFTAAATAFQQLGATPRADRMRERAEATGGRETGGG
ncbi:MAG: tetratricopeptide repeat protein [Gemmatimonadota bacterium]|nr:tetratricopeptide repeat protein [Gemmatimonadota bacterium]